MNADFMAAAAYLIKEPQKYISSGSGTNLHNNPQFLTHTLTAVCTCH
jgi:hypothetical protein